MTEFEECAQLCEEHGFDRAARLFRDAGEGRASIFLVWPTAFADRLPSELRGQWWFHPHRDVAQSIAMRQNIAGLRTLRTTGPFFDQANQPLTSLSIPEFLRQARMILGPTYWLPRGGNTPLFPRTATDAQLRALLPLLRFRFYEVIEVSIAG